MARVAALIGGVLLILSAGACGPRSAAPSEGELSTEGKREVTAFWDLFRSAETAFRAGRYADAAPLYERALALRPMHEASVNHLATCRLELADTAGAISILEEFSKTDPRNSRAHTRLGAIYSTPAPGAKIDLVAAQRHYARALELNRADSGPALQLGRIALYRGELESAERDLRQASSLDFRSIEGPRLLARVLALDGKPAAARKVLEELLARLGAAAAPQGKTGEGETHVDRDALRANLLPAFDDLRRLAGAADTAEPYVATSRLLAPPWPAWRPTAVAALPNGRPLQDLPETTGGGTLLEIHGPANGGADATGAPRCPPLPRGAHALIADLDGDGHAEIVVALPVGIEEALSARLLPRGSATAEPSIRIYRRSGDALVDVSGEWLAHESPLRVPVRVLAARDLDGDGRLDLYLGCGSEDPLVIHPDVVLLQRTARRFTALRVDLGLGDEHGTRRILEGGRHEWILDRSSLFPPADREKPARIALP